VHSLTHPLEKKIIFWHDRRQGEWIEGSVAALADADGDVRLLLAVAESLAEGAGFGALEKGAFVGVAFADVELGFVHAVVVLRIGCGRDEGFKDWFTGAVAHELELHEALLVVTPTNGVEHLPDLEG